MKRFVFWLVAALLTLGAAGIARWLGGDSAAGWALMIIAVSAETTLGVGWGSRQSTETEKYRKALIAGRRMPAAGDPLEPDPKNVVALVSAAITESWPATESERKFYFSRLHLTERDDLESEHPKVKSGLLIAPSLGGAEGLWATVEDRLLSITLFFYTDPRPGPSAAELGYGAVHEKLDFLLGSPVQENTSQFGEATALWRAGEKLIEVSCHSRHVDSLEIEIKHAARAEEYGLLLTAEPDQP